MERKYCVYRHTSPSGKSYIGITSRKPEKRWNYGKGYVDNEYFYNAINKYGWRNFTHEILCTGLTEEQASWLEKELIARFDLTNRLKGYNIDCGGIGTQKVMSEETRQKIGDSHRGRYTEAQWAATNARRGIRHPHTLSEEHRKKLSEAHKGKKPSSETMKKLKEINEHRVLQFGLCGKFIAEYRSLKGAEEKMGIKYQCISACCCGRAKTAGGYIWRYADNGENETVGAV